MKHRTPLARRQRGFSSVEYAIGAVFLCLVFFGGSPSLLDRLMAAVRDNHSARTYAVGAPLVGAGVRP